MFRHAQRACDGSAASHGPANAAAASGAIAPEMLSGNARATGVHALGEPERAVRAVAELGLDVAERRLLATIRRGRRSALRRLHSRYFARLVNFFTHLAPTSSAEVIENLVADTMYEVWRSSASVERSPSVHVAIMRIAWVHACTHLANSQRQLPSAQPSESDPPSKAWLPSTPRLPPLSDVLATLHVNERAVVHLVHSGHSRQEVLDILRMSSTTVEAYWASSMIALHPWLAARHSPTFSDRWQQS